MVKVSLLFRTICLPERLMDRLNVRLTDSRSQESQGSKFSSNTELC
jgi:hypothetical protein